MEMQRKDVAPIVADVVEKLACYAERNRGLTGRDFDFSSLVVVCVLARFMDLSELRGYLPRSTYYRYLRRLRAAGILPGEKAGPQAELF